jgi:transmembrane sensor
MSNAIADIAADWVVRMSAGPLSAEEQTRLDAWVGADPRHQGALLRAQAGWRDLDRLAALHGQLSIESTGASALASTDAAPEVPSWKARFTPAWRYAASVLIAVGISVAMWGALNRHPAHVTQVGEMRRVALPEGSILTLNTDSDAVIAFDEQRRRVILRRGEATFQVAHDTQRPFLVVAGDITVKAVGTAFDVRLTHGLVDVTVTEGVVEVFQGEEGQAAARRVGKNTIVRVPASGVISTLPLPAEQAQRRLAWQEGLLVFQGESLAQAAAEFSRYSEREIHVDGTALAAQPVFGVFHTHDVSAFVQAAASSFEARVVETDDSIRLIGAGS